MSTQGSRQIRLCLVPEILRLIYVVMEDLPKLVSFSQMFLAAAALSSLLINGVPF